MNYRQRFILNMILSFDKKTISFKWLKILVNKSERTIRRDIEQIENTLSIGINLDNILLLKNNKYKILKNIPHNSSLNEFEHKILEIVHKYKQKELNENLFLGKLIKNIGNFYLPYTNLDPQEVELGLPFLHPKVRQVLQEFFIFNKSNQKNINHFEKLTSKFPNQLNTLLIQLQWCYKNFFNLQKIQIQINFQQYMKLIKKIFKEWINKNIDENTVYINYLYSHLQFSNVFAQNTQPQNPILKANKATKKLLRIIQNINLKNQFIFDELSFVYFMLIAYEIISFQHLELIIACYGGLGTSVMLKSIIKKHFINSNIKVIPILLIKRYIRTKYDLIIIVGSDPFNTPKSIIIHPSLLIKNEYLIIKEINMKILAQIS